jgi:AraC-like DNA-binding protein
LYVLSVTEPPRIRAWRPAVPGVAEVFHARFTDHAYPMHAHDSWTLLLVDDGVVGYDLDRHEHVALDRVVTLLPPSVPHNGHAVSPQGFRKRVLYLDRTQLDEGLVGPAVDAPVIVDPTLRTAVHRLHGALARPGEEFESESRLALVAERLRGHLARLPPAAAAAAPRLAGQLRDLLDARTVDGIGLAEAAALLHAHPTHLVRAFGREFGMAPHRYLTSRRVDRARTLILDGRPLSEVATAAGFYDQSHLHRHFTRIVGGSPGEFAAALRGVRAARVRAGAPG